MKKVGDILREYLRERGWLTENPYAALFAAWSTVAGEALAAHAQLRDVRDGVMIVSVDHPGWLQIARLRKEALLAGARAAAPAGRLDDVRFFLGSGDR
jgi:predicted nucleic acid-binding Zn ribbon protein